jgi:transmembrane protein EpsG
MAIYILTFLASLLLFVLIAKNRKARPKSETIHKLKKKKLTRFGLAVFLSSLPPMFISAVRYYVGTDYLKTYYSGFYRILEGSKIDGFEIGFYSLNKLIQVFSNNAFWLFAITAIITVGMTYKAIGDLSVDVPLSIVLYLVTRYYFIGMNAVRQFMGLAILTYSLKYVFEEDIKKFAICVLLASAFHYTCLLFIPVYFISKLNLNFRQIVLLLIVTFILFTFGISAALKYFSGTKYALLALKYDLAGIKFSAFTIVLNIGLFAIGYKSHSRHNDDKKYSTCLNLQFLATLTSFGLRSIPLMERVYWIYSFPIIITFPYILNLLSNKSIKRYVKWGVIMIFTVYMVYDICVLGDHDVIPYRWIFGEKATHFSGWQWYGGFFK